LYSENNRYGFHRGIDIATPNGTPFYAITDGIVMTAGDHPSYSDPLVSVRHFQPGENSCDSGGCYQSQYLCPRSHREQMMTCSWHRQQEYMRAELCIDKKVDEG